MGVLAEAYIKETVDGRAEVRNWTEKNLLPVFLRENFYYEMTILGTTIILMEIIGEIPGIDTLKKHIRRVESLANHQIVLLFKNITRYRRKSLIENRIPFIIENGQIYLPFIGLDLKKAPENIQTEIKQFTASAQMAYLYFLYHKNEVVNMTEFAERMGLSKMTASRALNDLYHANLITCEIGGQTGRSKKYSRIPDPEYYLIGRSCLKNPVMKIVYTKTEPPGSLTAGIDALAQLSMLNDPGYPVRAMSRDEFNKQKIEIITNMDLVKDVQLIKLELWDYDPKQLSDSDHVDLLSLYASLAENNDERIEQALNEVLQDEPWYMA